MTNARTVFFVLATTLVAATAAAPVDSEKAEALRFLRVYGFLKDDGESLSSDNATSLRRALSLFQDYQLSGNDALDAVTLSLMRKSQCGLADVPDRAYSPIARKWPKTRLTWNFQVASEELSRTAKAAFALWAVNSSLTFRRDSLRADILISYRTGAHTYAKFLVKLNVEDILAIQNLYGSHDDGNYPTATPATTAAPATTSVAPMDSARADLCAMRRVDAALIMNHRLYIANRRNVWSIDVTERLYGRPMTLTDYAAFLPANFTRLSAAYRRPLGDLALFADDSIYLAEYPSLKLKSGLPRYLHDIGLPRNVKINAAINTHTGRTYAIYDDDKVAEIDECRMIVIRHAPLKNIFTGIPSAITSAFRYIDGNLYFFAKRQFYAFNEFTNIVTLAGPFDLHALGIECPTDGLLRQLRDLLSRVYRLGDATERERIDEEDD
ncbi:neutrophil collagenase-like [Formica exsecta]|uniref:neutrophil collagenase-like n=1 Tax=Formica exsecta TaxID=72781 RepID=UPI0011440CA1|nr:neutrophil collagenase-like [Formica exsecta]